MNKNIFIFFLFFVLACAYFFNALVNRLLPFYMDIYGYFYPIMGIIKEQYLQGVLPLWNNYMFSGFPLMASSQPGVLYPVSAFITVLFPMNLTLIFDLTVHLTLGGFFTYLYAKKTGAEDFGAFCAGTLFAFMGYMIFHIEFISMLRTAVWLPLLLYFFEEMRQKPDVRTAFKAAVTIAVQIFAGHPQIYFFTYLTLSFFIVYYSFFVKPGLRLKFIYLSICAFALGFIMASPQLFAVYELSSLGVRTEPIYENFAKHSFTFNRIPALLFPSFFSGKTEGYIGRLPFLLAITAFIVGRKNNIHIKFWSFFAVVSLALALGDSIRPLHKLMFHVPVYNSFRGFSKHLMEFDLSLALLSALGITLIINSAHSKKALTWLLALMLAVISASSVFALSSGGMKLMNPGTIIPIIFLLFCSVASIFILRFKQYNLFKYIVIIAVLIEIISYRPLKWTKTSQLDNYESQLFSMLEDKKERAAFLGQNIIPLLATKHKINITEGYDPLILNDYDLLLQLGGIGGWTDAWQDIVKHNSILSMLNTKYLVLPPGMAIHDPSAGYKLLLNTPSGNIYENTRCLPRAHSVSEVVGFKTTEEIRDALFSKRIDPAKQAAVLMGDLQKIGKQKFADGDVAITEYRDTQVRMRTEFSGAGFIVLADQYYPGWKAYINNSPAEIYKTNTVLRGIKIPAGKHEIIFKYQPWPIYSFLILSALTFIIIVILLFKWKKSA